MRAFTALVFLVASLPAEAATYYVASDGTGSTPCVISDPCSLATAKAAVRTDVAAGLSANERIIMRGGTYTITETLPFTAADSGTSSYRVTWESYQGELPVLSGGVAVTGWSDEGGGIFSADVGAGWTFRSLFVDGVHATRARGSNLPGGWLQTATGFTAPDSSYAAWGNPTDIEIACSGGWAVSRCKVASIVDDAVTMNSDCWDVQYALGKPSNPWFDLYCPFFLENAYELLDTAGEWYLDRSTGTVYYMPSDSTMTGHTVVAPKVETLLSFNGASYISVVNIGFAHSSDVTSETGGDLPWSVNYRVTTAQYCATGAQLTPPPAISITDSTGIEFHHCDFDHMSSGVTMFGDNADSLVVTESRFYDIAGTAIHLGNVQEWTATSDNVTITRNEFGRDSLWDYYGNSTVALVAVNGATVTQNDYYRDTSDGWSGFQTQGFGDWDFEAGSGQCMGNVTNLNISYNRLYDEYGSNTADGALLYLAMKQSSLQTLATGTVYTGNYVRTGGGHYCFYNDFDSGYVTASGNFCEGAAWLWTNTYITSPAPVWQTWTSNLTTLGKYSMSGTNTSVSGTRVTAYRTDAEAQGIIRRAGIPRGVYPGQIPNQRSTLWSTGQSAPTASWGGWR